MTEPDCPSPMSCINTHALLYIIVSIDARIVRFLYTLAWQQRRVSVDSFVSRNLHGSKLAYSSIASAFERAYLCICEE